MVHLQDQERPLQDLLLRSMVLRWHRGAQLQMDIIGVLRLLHKVLLQVVRQGPPQFHREYKGCWTRMPP